MTSTTAILAGLALAGGIAAAQQQEPQEYDPDRTIVSDPEREDRTGMDDETDVDDYDTQAQTQPADAGDVQPETGPGEAATESIYGADPVTDIAEMSAAELVGRPVILEDGGLVGNIREVGYSETHRARVAVIDVSGFVGAGANVIAIPLAELRQDRDGNVMTSMTRQSIRTRDDFDTSELLREK